MRHLHHASTARKGIGFQRTGRSVILAPKLQCQIQRTQTVSIRCTVIQVFSARLDLDSAQTKHSANDAVRAMCLDVLGMRALVVMHSAHTQTMIAATVSGVEQAQNLLQTVIAVRHALDLPSRAAG